jgi:hypothetical protein
MRRKVAISDHEAAKDRRGMFICGGLIAVSLIIVHALISLPKLDTPGWIALLAFAGSIPLLAGCLFILVTELDEKYYIISWWVHVSAFCFFAGVLGTIIGVAATFWRSSWIAGLIFLLGALLMFIVVVFYFDEDDIKLQETHEAKDR